MTLDFNFHVYFESIISCGLLLELAIRFWNGDSVHALRIQRQSYAFCGYWCAGSSKREREQRYLHYKKHTFGFVKGTGQLIKGGGYNTYYSQVLI